MVDTEGTRNLGRRNESAEGGSPHLDARVRVRTARVQELFKWLDPHKRRGHRVCEHKVHHPRAMSDILDQLNELIADEASRLEHKHELAISAFTNAVARLMADQGLSQSDLAHRLGVSRARVSQLLQHTSSPTLRTMVHIANALGCEVAPSLAPCGLRPPRLFVADGGKTIAGS